MPAMLHKPFRILRSDLAAPLSAETLLLGRSFVAKDPSFGVVNARRRVSAKGQSAGGLALGGDPTVDGASLTMETDTASQTVALPASEWTVVRDGFSYIDSIGANGPTRRVKLKRNALGEISLKVSLSGAYAQLDILPPNPGTEASIAVAITGGDTYCAHFGGVAGGTVMNDGNRRFRVQKPTAVGPCPPGGGPP